jgi:hypothetical protein
MQPIRDSAGWLKRTWLKHPHLTGAVATGAAVIAVVGTGGTALFLGVPAVLAGAGLSNAIASDPGSKEDTKKEEEKKDV